MSTNSSNGLELASLSAASGGSPLRTLHALTASLQAMNIADANDRNPSSSEDSDQQQIILNDLPTGTNITTTFALFSKLAIEIRLCIWKLAATQPRVFKFTVAERRIINTLSPGAFLRGVPFLGPEEPLVIRYAYPSVLHANHEARQVALQEYQITTFFTYGELQRDRALYQLVKLFDAAEPSHLHPGWPRTIQRGPNISTPLYFGAHDIIYMPESRILEDTIHVKSLDIGGTDSFYRKIKHLAVEGRLIKLSYQEISRFVNLETLILERPQMNLSAVTSEHHKAELLRQDQLWALFTVTILKEKQKMNKKLIVKFLDREEMLKLGEENNASTSVER